MVINVLGEEQGPLAGRMRGRGLPHLRIQGRRVEVRSWRASCIRWRRQDW